MQFIAAFGYASIDSVSTRGVDVEPDQVSCLLEAEIGAFELALLILPADSIVLVESKCAGSSIGTQILCSEAIDMNRKRIDSFLGRVLHFRPERDDRARAHVGWYAIKGDFRPFDFTAT